MKAEDVQKAVRNQVLQSQEYRLENSFMFNWECDMFAISKSGYSTEVEVKVSKSDYRRDFEKDKHRIINELYEGKKYIMFNRYDAGKISNPGKPNHGQYSLSSYCHFDWRESEKVSAPNRFYFACPTGIIMNDVPRYAGLIWINGSGQAEIIKKAPLIHKNKYSSNAKLLGSFYHRRNSGIYELSVLRNLLTSSLDFQKEDIISNINRIIKGLR